MRNTEYLIQGRKYAAIEWGDPVGEPIVLLHGFLDHAGAWRDVAEQLPGWRIAFDQRGHGQSAHVPEGETYHFADYLADLDALSRQVGPMHLVGHSMGGTVASMYAGVRSDRVLSLTIVDGLGLQDSTNEAVDRMARFLDDLNQPPRNKVFASIDEAVARLRSANPHLGDEYGRFLAERGTVQVPGGFTWSWDPRHRMRGPIPYRHDNHAQFLRRITCRVLSIRPEFTPFSVENCAALESCIPKLERRTIPGATHMVHLENPEAVAEAIRAHRTPTEPVAQG
jgi:pimeloyl-ACP methyl ester carboxylesterase